MQRLGPAGLLLAVLMILGAAGFAAVPADAQNTTSSSGAAATSQDAAKPAPEATPAPAPAAGSPAEVPQASPAATPQTPAKPDTVEQHPATATTPAIPAPGSQPSDLKPGDSPEPSAGPRKEVAGTGSSLLPHDLSPYGMFMNADIVVKAVMIGLIFASFVTWTIFIAKALEITAAKMRAQRALNELAEAPSLVQAVAQLKSPKAPVTRLAQAALAETERSRGLAADGVKERAAALLARIEARAGRAMTKGTGLLATIGSTAPFVGLFGTVWGIMNSFIGISKTNTTNLAVVAPGIAEALLATACGLVAAIPAVIIYNMFARSIGGFRSVLNDASAEVLRLLSRDLDRESGADGIVPMARRAAAE